MSFSASHRFILQPYKGMASRFRCPLCQHRDKSFTRYIDTETGEYLHPDVGRCSRENNCGHHYPPKQYFQDNSISFDKPATFRDRIQPEPIQQKAAYFIPADLFKASLKGYSENNFVQFLTDKFGADAAGQAISRYFIGSSKHWQGAATTFWQIDRKGNIRAGKVMLYNPENGKRIKDSKNSISWVHSMVKFPDFTLQQCFFGEHLLADKSKTAAIVESEKSAIIGSIYWPEFIWLATGGLDGLNAAKFSILNGRTVIIFPDLSKPKEGKQSAFEIWSSKARDFQNIASIKISDLLEREATDQERIDGLDIADYLLRFKPEEFTTPGAVPKASTEPQPAARPAEAVKPLPTAEDVIFSKMAAKCPKVEQFATALNLVSAKTGKPFEIVPIEAPEQSEPATEQEPTEEDIRKLDAIAERILMPQQSYTAEEVQQLIEATLKLSSDRAKAGTQKMIDFGAIQPTLNNRYYLRDSTPF